MPYRRTCRTHRPAGTTTTVRTTRTKPSLLDRLTGNRGHTATTRTTRSSGRHHHHHTHTHAAPVHHQKRKPTLGDKVTGALIRLKGTLTGRPGVKAAGTRRQRGTDGRGRRRHYY
ncbi:hypothetical protein ABW19_dt0208009 [Dactylella cylindrospora]|nr:hypothetical protein ABW19_dt0208009 [Dactylella cylindrospora]